MSDEFGGVPVADATATDEFGGVAVSTTGTATGTADEFGGVPVAVAPAPAATAALPANSFPHRDPYLVSTTAGGPQMRDAGSPGAGARLGAEMTLPSLGDIVNALPDAESTYGVYKDISRPAVAIPKFTINPDDHPATAVGKEAVNILTGLPEFFESPLGIATAGAGAILPKTVATLFTADTLHTLGNQVQDAHANWGQMTGSQKAAAVTDMVGSGVMAGLLAHGAVHGLPAAAEEVQSPESKVQSPPAMQPDEFGGVPVQPIAALPDEFGGVPVQTPVPPAEPAPAVVANAEEASEPAATPAAAAPVPESSVPETTEPSPPATATAPAEPAASVAPELMTTEQFDAAKLPMDPESYLADAVAKGKPVSASLVEATGLQDQAKETGYVKQGDLYVLPESANKSPSGTETAPVRQVASEIKPFQITSDEDRRQAIEQSSNPSQLLSLSTYQIRGGGPESTHLNILEAAVKRNEPVSASLVIDHGQPVPPGYTQRGSILFPDAKTKPKPTLAVERPSLGSSVDEVLQKFQNYRPIQGEQVIARVTGSPDVISTPEGLAFAKTYKTTSGGNLAGTTLMKPDEVKEFRDDIAHGVAQIEVRRTGGAMGMYAKSDAGKTTRVLHQATGRPLDAENKVAGFGGGKSRPRKGPQQVPVPAAVAKTPAPTTGPVRTWLQTTIRGFQNVFAPHTIDDSASTVANILRDVNGERANNLARADEAMHTWRKEFDRTPVPANYQYDPAKPLPHNYAVIDAMERDRTALAPRYQPLAQYFDQAFKDRISVIQKFAPQALQHLITNYFPHVWKDPERAAGVMSQVATRLFSGRKEFLKERSLPFFQDGIARGLKPISDNPVDMLLAKMHSMDKFIAALKAQAEFRAIGKMKFNYALEGMPDGWQKVDDPAFVVHAPPVVTVREAFDQFQRAKLGELLQYLGVNYKRVARLGGSRWAEADQGAKEIRAQVGSTEDILWHELGHHLDWQFPELRNQLDMRGNSVEAQQLRRLVDLNHPGTPHNPKLAYHRYLRSDVEKMAEIFRAYVHAPDLFHQKASEVWRKVNAWLDTRPDIRQRLDAIKPGMQIGHEDTNVKLGGVLKLGDWIMPDGPAQVIKNYLSPGLARSGIYRSVRAASNLMNAAQLGLSGFHVGFTSLDAAISTITTGLHDATHGKPLRGAATVAKSPFAPFANYFTGKAVQRAMLDPNAKTMKAFGMDVGISKAAHDYAALAVKGGLRATVDPFWQTHMTRNLVRAIHEGGLAWAKTPLYAPLALVEQAMRPISEYLVPRQKLGVFALMAKREMERLPPNADVADVRSAMARAADATEDRMGQMTYDNLFYNKTAKDLSLLAFRAYGWQLGKYRHLMGAVADTAGNVKQIAGGKLPDLTQRQLYFVALPLMVAAVGGVLNRIFTGKNPQKLADYFHPQTGQLDAGGNPKRLSLPTYMKDLESDGLGLANGWKTGGVVGAGQGVWTSTYHRLNPAVSMMVDMLNNRDFYGTQIWNPDDSHLAQLGEQAKFIAKTMEPFSISGAQKLSQGQASLKDKVLPFFGVVPASRILTMTPTESYYSDAFRDLMPGGSKTAEQSEQAQLRAQLVTDLKSAKTSGTTIPDLPARMIAAGVKDQASLTRLGQKAEWLPIQYQANYLPLVQAMRGYDLANDQEKAALATVLMPRVQNAWEKDRLDDTTTSTYVKQLAPFYRQGK